MLELNIATKSLSSPGSPIQVSLLRFTPVLVNLIICKSSLSQSKVLQGIRR